MKHLKKYESIQEENIYFGGEFYYVMNNDEEYIVCLGPDKNFEGHPMFAEPKIHGIFKGTQAVTGDELNELMDILKSEDFPTETL